MSMATLTECRERYAVEKGFRGKIYLIAFLVTVFNWAMWYLMAGGGGNWLDCRLCCNYRALLHKQRDYYLYCNCMPFSSCNSKSCNRACVLCSWNWYSSWMGYRYHGWFSSVCIWRSIFIFSAVYHDTVGRISWETFSVNRIILKVRYYRRKGRDDGKRYRRTGLTGKAG